MPPKPKFTKEQMLDAAYEIVREGGAESLTARKLGAALGSSARPIFTLFSNMDEVMNAVRDMAVKRYFDYLSEAFNTKNPFKEFGDRTVIFAKNEPNLFLLIYEPKYIKDDKFAALFEGHDGVNNIMVADIVKVLQVSEDDARDMVEKMFICSHGIASILITGFFKIEDDDVVGILCDFCVAMALRYKALDGTLTPEIAHEIVNAPEYHEPIQ